MYVSRYVWGSIVVFVYLVLVEWLFHGVIMSGFYNDAIQLLRPETEASGYTIWMLLGFLILAFGFSFIYTKGYEGKGLVEGLRYGLYVGFAFSVSSSLIFYAVFPFPASWIIGWIIGDLVIMIIAGLILAAIYKPRPAAAPSQG